MDFTPEQLHALKSLLDAQRKAIAEDTQQAIETSRKAITEDTQQAIKASETKVIERIDILENNLLQVMEDTANTYAHQDDFVKLSEQVTKLEQH